MTTHLTQDDASRATRVDMPAVFAEIRAVLNRPDLSDQTLLDHLAEGRFDPWCALSRSAFLAGGGSPEARTALIRSLQVPPPAHGLDMPEHDLAPDLLGGFAARLIPLWRRAERAITPGRPQLKRAVAVQRGR